MIFLFSLALFQIFNLTTCDTIGVMNSGALRSVEEFISLNGTYDDYIEVVLGRLVVNGSVTNTFTVQFDYDDEDILDSFNSSYQATEEFLLSNSELVTSDDLPSSFKRDEENLNRNHILGVIKFLKTIAQNFYNLSGILISTGSQWLNDIMHGEHGGQYCMARTESIPIGKSWDDAAAVVRMETCASKGNSCSTTVSESIFKEALEWADHEIATHPNRAGYKVDFSPEGAWKYCVRIIPKSVCGSKSSCYNKVESMGCPKGFCDGEI